MPYVILWLASKPATLRLNDAVISDDTMIVAPTHIIGRRKRGHRCNMIDTSGQPKYMIPVCVVPIAAMAVFE